MPGPAPKDRDERSNHRQPVFGEWRDVPPLTEPVLPDLPDLNGIDQWNARTQRMWTAWRQDFVTQLYGPSEIAMAIELAFLYEKAVRDSKATMWSEVRQWMDRLMLTPKGKRDARVRLTEKIAEQPAADKPKLAAVIRLVDDAVAS